MSLRITALLILTTMTLAAGFAIPSVGSVRLTDCNPDHERSTRTLRLTVPANRAVTFPLVDLGARLFDRGHGPEAALMVARPNGSLRFSAANETGHGRAQITPSGLTFEPSRGFVGVSKGWIVAFQEGQIDAATSGIVCATPLADDHVQTVMVTFEVRNTLPVTFDDEVVMPAMANLMAVGPESGVLANDLDWNGDPLVVHSAGLTSFPWGTVDLAPDGSYRIMVTNRELLAPATVPYVVWDQHGSPTSIDTGYLQIDFSSAENE